MRLDAQFRSDVVRCQSDAVISHTYTVLVMPYRACVESNDVVKCRACTLTSIVIDTHNISCDVLIALQLSTFLFVSSIYFKRLTLR